MQFFVIVVAMFNGVETLFQSCPPSVLPPKCNFCCCCLASAAFSAPTLEVIVLAHLARFSGCFHTVFIATGVHTKRHLWKVRFRPVYLTCSRWR